MAKYKIQIIIIINFPSRPASIERRGKRQVWPRPPSPQLAESIDKTRRRDQTQLLMPLTKTSWALIRNELCQASIRSGVGWPAGREGGREGGRAINIIEKKKMRYVSINTCAHLGRDTPQKHAIIIVIKKPWRQWCILPHDDVISPPLLLLRQSSVRFGRGRKFGDTYQSSSVPSSPLMTRLELLLTPSLPSPPLPSPALFPWIQSRIHHHQPPASGNSRPMRDTIIFNSRPGDPLSFANRYFN